MELSIIAPYFVSILASIISGISSYFVARNKSAADIQTLKESNEHEIEKLMKQHEVDLDNLKGLISLRWKSSKRSIDIPSSWLTQMPRMK